MSGGASSGGVANPPIEKAKPFSIAFGASKPKSVVPSKRPGAALTQDSDHEDESSVPEAVSGFDSSGAISAKHDRQQQTKEPLVIPVQKDADWRDPGKSRRKGKNLLPQEARADLGTSRPANSSSDSASQYGLIINRNREDAGNVEENRHGSEAENGEAKEPAAMSLDDEAYQRLLDGDKKASSLVITSVDGEDSGWTGRKESDDFRTDVALRPDSSTVADYEAVPIEEFGAAMLRGMGWRDGQGVGRGNQSKKQVNPKVLEKRPNLLGIGAKQTPDGLEELGAWGKGAKDGKNRKAGPKTRENYNPVVMKNSKTGEILTEEELRERQKKVSEEPKDLRQREDGRGRDRDDSEERYHDRDRDRRTRDRERSTRKEAGGSDRRRQYEDRDRDRDRRDVREDYGRDRSKYSDTTYRDRDRRERKRDRDDERDHSYRRSRSPKRRNRSRDHGRSARERHEDRSEDDMRERHREKHRDRHRERHR